MKELTKERQIALSIFKIFIREFFLVTVDIVLRVSCGLYNRIKTFKRFVIVNDY